MVVFGPVSLYCEKSSLLLLVLPLKTKRTTEIWGGFSYAKSSLCFIGFTGETKRTTGLGLSYFGGTPFFMGFTRGKPRGHGVIWGELP